MNNQKNNIMKIRGHHLLCIQSFKGFGYNEHFIDNMHKIISAIKKSKDLVLHIVAECDDICSYCPHITSEKFANRKCAKDKNSEIELRELDLNVLDKFNLDIGTLINAREVYKLIREEINKDTNTFKICGSCRWIEICINDHSQSD